MKIINPSVIVIISTDKESAKDLASLFCDKQDYKAESLALKKYRKASGKTQKEMAEILGLKQSTYSNYENGIRKPSGEMLQKIADVLNVPVDREAEYEDVSD